MRKGFECHEDQEETDEHGQGDEKLQSVPRPDLVFKLDAFHFSFAEQVVDVGGDEDGIVVHDAKDGDELLSVGLRHETQREPTTRATS